MKPIRELMLIAIALGIGYGTIVFAKQVEAKYQKTKQIQLEKTTLAE